MTEFFSTLVRSFEKLTPLFCVVSVCTGAVLFLPEGLKEPIGIKVIPPTVQPWIGLVFLFSLSSCAVNLIRMAWLKVAQWSDEKSLEKAQHDVLNSLTSEERAVLLPYVVGGVTTQEFEVGNGVIGVLQAKNIVFVASNISKFMRLPFGIQPWAKKSLQRSPQRLNGYCERTLASILGHRNPAALESQLSEDGIHSRRMIRNRREIENEGDERVQLQNH